MNKKGFTLVEIMIVVLIIGLLAAIAIPNFIKARKTTQRNACIDNLRAIEGAIEQAKMEGIAAPTYTDLFGSDKYIKGPTTGPTCPASKVTYGIPTGDDRPVCPNPSINGTGTDEQHVLK